MKNVFLKRLLLIIILINFFPSIVLSQSYKYFKDLNNNGKIELFEVKKNSNLINLKLFGSMKLEDIPYSMRQKNWTVAAKLMEYWFEGSGRNYYVSIYDLRYMSEKIYQEYEFLSSRNGSGQILNDEMKHSLIKQLKKTDNQNGGKIIPDGGYFNHINSELILAEDMWHDYDWEKNNMHWIHQINIEGDVLVQDDYSAAFSRAALRYVAQGEVIINEGIAKIIVNRVGMYFRDSYDFIKDSFFEQNLGCWSTEFPYFSFSQIEFQLLPHICVDNGTFRNYNRYKGRDVNHGNFRIFSKPKLCNFFIREVFKYNIKEQMILNESEKSLSGKVDGKKWRDSYQQHPPADWDNEPNGRKWTDIAHTAIVDLGSELLNANPQDIREYCPSYESLNIDQRSPFWVYLISKLSSFESNHDPNASFTEDFLDSNGNPVISRGLLQISKESANGYGCGIINETELHDPETNIRCGVRILNRWVARDGVIAKRINGNWRGAARYWSPFRSDSNRSHISSATASQSYCQ